MTVITADSKKTFEAIKKFHDTLTHMYGTTHSTILQNTQGDITRNISTSLDLFTYLKPKCEELRLMLVYLKSQAELNKDGGLYTALLSSNLMLKLHSEDIPHAVVMTTMDFLLSKVTQFVNTLEAKINIGRMRDVFLIIKPIVTSKVTLKRDELQHISLLFAKIFANTLNLSSDVQVVLNESSNIMCSSVYDGVLLPLERYVDKTPLSVGIGVILITVSIAFDSEEFVTNPGSNVIIESTDNFKSNIMQTLMKFCDQIIPHVGVVICQKVVHPLLKRHFKLHNVLCIDRVGSRVVPNLEQVLNCKGISSLSITNPEKHVGRLENGEFLEINKRHFLKICCSKINYLNSLLLCGKNEEFLETLKFCYYACMTSLKCLVTNPGVVYGAGCTETLIAMYLRDLVCTEDEWKSVDVSSYMLTKLTNVVVHSFLRVASAVTTDSYYTHSIDVQTNHHWINNETSEKCCCGLIEKNNQEFISFTELLLQTGTSHERIDRFNLPSSSTTTNLPLVHSREVYLSNTTAAFQLASTISRIGVKIISS